MTFLLLLSLSFQRVKETVTKKNEIWPPDHTCVPTATDRLSSRLDRVDLGSGRYDMTTAADSVNGTCAAVSSGSNARYEAPASARYEYLDHRLDTTGKKKHILREKGSFWLDELIVKHL